jgi:uncharacterized membrane protein YciS (DUF1049 family)
MLNVSAISQAITPTLAAGQHRSTITLKYIVAQTEFKEGKLLKYAYLGEYNT